jgi:hypothetical protein
VISGPAVPAAVSAPAAVAEHPIGALLLLVLGVGLLVLLGFVMVRRRGPRGGPGKQRPAPATAPSRGPWNIPARPELIAGRDKLLAKVSGALDEGGRVVLHGPDGEVGVGVTTVMIELAHRNRNGYDIVWLVSAEDPALVPDRMAELAAALGSPNRPTGRSPQRPGCSRPCRGGSGGCWSSTTPRARASWSGPAAGTRRRRRDLRRPGVAG